MPKAIIYIGIVIVILAMIPPAIIARKRAVHTPLRRIHLIQDMDNQGKFRAQHVNPIFADQRAMRPPVEGTVAVGELYEDDHYHRGISAPGVWADTLPAQLPITVDRMLRGQERFDIYCSICHGAAGYGDGIINKRAFELMATGKNGTTWVQVKNMHEPLIRVQPVGQIFNTITHGIRTMPPYESQIPVDDRWAIALYVKALQRSQFASPDDLPDGLAIENLPLLRLPPEAPEQPAPDQPAPTATPSTPEAGP